MDQRIIYTDPIGGNVCVVTPAVGASIDAVAAKVVPPGVTWKAVDASAIPTDRSFRNAWKISGNAISEDWAKSVEITKERLRAERAPLLAAADVQALREVEATGVVSTKTATLKQSLRDVTALADSAKSRDELLALKAAAVVKA